MRPTPGPVNEVLLREVTADDLPVFFQQQLDQQAIHMAAFTAKDPSDREAFNARWLRILGDRTNTIRTILYQGNTAGYILSYVQSGNLEVGYWLGREYWGKGIATRALAAFLDQIPERPVYARTAKDNLASLRVLQKCGFSIAWEGKGYANARSAEIEEWVLKLSRPEINNGAQGE